MPNSKDDLTTVLTVGRNERLAYENYLMSSRVRTDDDDTDTDLQLSLQLSIPPFYHRVIDINDIFRQIIALINGPDSDNEGVLKPTQHAIDRVASLLIAACSAFPKKFPKADVSPDLEGGLRIEWRSPRGVARIVIPPRGDEKEYLYSRMDGASKTDFNLSGTLIASWLQKVMQ